MFELRPKGYARVNQVINWRQGTLRVGNREETAWCYEKKVGFRIRSPGFGLYTQIVVPLLTSYLILNKSFSLSVK